MTQSEHVTPPAAAEEMPPWLEEPGPSREQVARELLIHQHLKRMHEASLANKRRAADAVFTKPGQREPADLDGAPLGDVRVDRGGSGWKVTDPAALASWARTNRPAEVMETIPLEELEDIVDRVGELLATSSSILMTSEGPAVLIRHLRHALEPRTTELSVYPAFVKAVVAAAETDGTIGLSEDEDGPTVRARDIPGVTYVEAPAKLVITVSKGEHGDQAQQAIMSRLGQAAAALGLDPRKEIGR